MKPENTLRCSFCNKTRTEVKTLIAGTTAFICNECVDGCVQAIFDEDNQHAVTPIGTEKLKMEWATAEDAYHIINSLLAHVQASSDLIAMMASSLGESATKSLTETQAWANYLSARRMMDHMTRAVEKFTATMAELARNRPDRPEESEE